LSRFRQRVTGRLRQALQEGENLPLVQAEQMAWQEIEAVLLDASLDGSLA